MLWKITFWSTFAGAGLAAFAMWWSLACTLLYGGEFWPTLCVWSLLGCIGLFLAASHTVNKAGFPYAEDDQQDSPTHQQPQDEGQGYPA
jgi:hypothetical protein